MNYSMSSYARQIEKTDQPICLFYLVRDKGLKIIYSSKRQGALVGQAFKT